MMTMTNPIKETPVLTGEDALRFEIAAQNVIPETREEKEKAKKASEFMRSIATFPL